MLTRQSLTEQWFAGEFDQSVVTFGQIKAWFLCFWFFFRSVIFGPFITILFQ